MTQPDKNRLLADTNARNDFNKAIVEEFRSNAGVVGGPFGGAALLLLHTVGAKSGEPRLSPLAYLTVDGKMLIFGSFAGAPKNPAWVHNLRGNPRAHIEVGTEAYDVEARELPREERDDLYAKLVEMVPALGEHQANTDRVIPLFELIRV
jgi:deazaflavin-dependent oxidoreductase (nitroreductase family)